MLTLYYTDRNLTLVNFDQKKVILPNPQCTHTHTHQHTLTVILIIFKARISNTTTDVATFQLDNFIINSKHFIEIN